MKAKVVVLTQGLCSPDLLQVLGASEIHRPENQGMLELPEFPLLEAFVSYGALGSTFLVWASPWNGCVPGSVCNSLLSSPVPLIFLVIVSSLFLYFISPFFLIHSFTYFLQFLPHPLLVNSPSSIHSQTSSLSFLPLPCVFPLLPSILPPQIQFIPKTQDKIKLLGKIGVGRT